MRMTARKRFGSVRVRLDELENGVLDFSKRLKASAPQRAEPELDTAARAAESSAARAADALPPSLKSDGIEGDEMSDGEDASWGGANKPQKGRRDIFGSIIAKWSNISAPDGGAADSDEVCVVRSVRAVAANVRVASRMVPGVCAGPYLT